MEFTEAKTDFIRAWGNLGESWGIGKIMAEIHALLLISPYPCSRSYVEKQLNIGAREAEKGLKELIEWGVIYEHEIASENNGHTYYKAEKDIWLLAQLVARKRREKELVPVIEMLGRVKQVKDNTDPEHCLEFKKVTSDIEAFAHKADKFLVRFANANSNWFFKQVLNWIR